MGDTEREKLMERIMKMHRKAQSLMESGNEAEAISFIEGVRKTLAMHNLEMSDVEFAVMQKEEPIKIHVLRFEIHGMGKKRIIPWQRMLAHFIAEAHFCSTLLIDKKTNAIALIGRHHDRLVAEFMIITMIRLCEKLADDAYTKEFYARRKIMRGLEKTVRGFRKGFITGFTERVCERYIELEKEQQELLKHGNGLALVRLNQEKALVKMVFDQAKGDSVNVPSMPLSVQASGYDQGRQAGDEVNLKGTGLAANAVGAGQKILGGGS